MELGESTEWIHGTFFRALLISNVHFFHRDQIKNFPFKASLSTKGAVMDETSDKMA